MIDKVMIVNQALEALGLGYQTSDPDTDLMKPVKTIMKKYRLGLASALADMDLQKTSTKVKLELLAKEHVHWKYVYKYPSKCVKFRKIVSPFPTDNRATMIPSATEVIDGIDVILTNEVDAYAEIISEDVNLSALSAFAGIAIGYYIASLCPSLIVGSKGKEKARAEILNMYRMYKAQAMGQDLMENVDSTPDEFRSEFVSARLGGSWVRRN